MQIEQPVRLDSSLELLIDHMPRAGRSGVLASIVSTVGSTYRKPGARMLILDDGSYFGLLSGGCLEADLKAHAADVLSSGRANAVEYDMRGPDDILFGLGAGCQGMMRILLEPANQDTAAARAMTVAARSTDAGEATTLVLMHDATDLPLGTFAPSAALPPAVRAAADATLRQGESRQVEWQHAGKPARAFVEYLAPPPHLLLCGAGPDATAVVNVARSLGWRVTLVDHRPAYAMADRFPGATVLCAAPAALRTVVDLERCHAVVVMSHHFNSDVDYLRILGMSKQPAYVGLLGPSARRQRLTQALGSAADGLTSRIRGPVGLDIGAATPEGIALAIVGQIHAWLAGRM